MHIVTPEQLVYKTRQFIIETEFRILRMRRLQRLAKDLRHDPVCYCQRCIPGQLKLV